VWCNKFKGLIWTAAALGALLVLAAGLAAAIEAGYFRGPLIRFVASQVGRAFVDPGLSKDADCGALKTADKTLH